MASSPSSSSAETIPTASSKKMRVRSKSTSAVDDSKEEVPIQSAKRVGNGVKIRFRDGINGTVQNGAESLFMKGPKDKHHDRKSRSGRRGLPKKGNSCFCLQLIILYILRKSPIQSVVLCSVWLQFVSLVLECIWENRETLIFIRIKTRLSKFMNITCIAVDPSGDHAAESAFNL